MYALLPAGGLVQSMHALLPIGSGCDKVRLKLKVWLRVCLTPPSGICF